MSNYYGLAFSNTDPSQYPSLAPTFLTFRRVTDGQTLAPPSLSQIDFTGVYGFTYAVTDPIYYRVDGITITSATDRYLIGILDPADNIDNQHSAGMTTLTQYHSTLTAIGASNVALGTTSVALGITNVGYGTSNLAINTTILAHGSTNFSINTTISAELSTLSAIGLTLDAKIGTTASLIGDNSTDPVDIFGYLKRMQEFNEGDQSFDKTSGAWTIQDRTGATTISTRTLDNTSTTVTRT